MKIWAVTMAKDEGDIIADSLLHMVEEDVDGIIVADNMSTDNTLSEIIRIANMVRHRCQIVIINDEEIGYYQSRKMTNLARLAAEKGADWIIPFDVDELWYASDRLSDFIKKNSEYCNVLGATIWNHFGTSVDGKDGNVFQRMNWKLNEKGALPKVAFKWHPDAVIHQGNHSVSRPKIVQKNWLEIRHFPYRSWEHFKRKAINGYAAYKASNLPEIMGSHWRNYGRMLEEHGDEIVRKEVFEKYFWFFSPTDSNMINDPAPFRRWNK